MIDFIFFVFIVCWGKILFIVLVLIVGMVFGFVVVSDF